MFVVDYKMMRSDTKFGAVIIITTVTCYSGDKFYFVGSLWRNESDGSVFGVVVLIEGSSSEEWYDLYWNKSFSLE